MQDPPRTLPTGSANEAHKAWLRALERTARIGQDPLQTLPAAIEDLAYRFGGAPALISEHESWSYRDLAVCVNRYSRWALTQGLAGSVVCLIMPNCPEYLAIWLGITRVGGVVALINTNLTGAVLAHAIDAAGPKHIIVGPTLTDAVTAVLPQLGTPVACLVTGSREDGLYRIEIEEHSGEPLQRSEHEPASITDRALLIYTSGTTGLPKAAYVSHFRLMQWSHWFAGMMDTGPSDRMYNCLPMFHGVGGVVATGAALLGGGSVVLRSRFSASSFWDDVVSSGCTLFQYIGELCRYLVNSPSHGRETQHRIRLCCGSGLSADVWERFQQRFRIPRVLEFYAATEGVFSLYNCEGKRGSIGRVPGFLAHRFPVALIRVDRESGEPVRDTNGRCIRCAESEIGEAIGRVGSDGIGGGRFEGYTDVQASERKLMRDVFAAGDTWFRTGDLMRQDAQGYFYFIERIGDTFRWKGETVSTSEVASVLAVCAGIVEAVVYGVSVPGN